MFRSLRIFIVVMIVRLTLISTAYAAQCQDSVNIAISQKEPLGCYMRIFMEQDTDLSVFDIRSKTLKGQYVTTSSKTPAFGIGKDPRWVHIVVDNPTDKSLKRFLAIQPTWTDYLDIYVLREGKIIKHWKTGDAVKGVPYLSDALGYVIAFPFLPDKTDVLIRFETADPMVLDVRLLTDNEVMRASVFEHYAYGFLYGFVGSLVLYNLVLFFGLKRRNSLYYSLYLSAFIAMNIAYTGHGLTWLWPSYPDFQRYIILILMIMTAYSGFYFAREFLNLDQLAPKLIRILFRFSLLSFLLMLFFIVRNDQEAAAWLAFFVMSVYVVVIVPIGIYAMRMKQNAAGYYLIAAIASIIGMSLTLFSVWGLIPFNIWTYRGMEIGIMLDATLLALALAEFVRWQMEMREKAEYVAQFDPLTKLLNRRAFLEKMETLHRIALRHERPLSIIMLDIDHFKQINDTYGHFAGDAVLKKIAQILQSATRDGDIICRWGGEEFILILPETDADSANETAERMRVAISNERIAYKGKVLNMTASFGIAQLDNSQDIDSLISMADKALYMAKDGGRNCVVHT